MTWKSSERSSGDFASQPGLPTSSDKSDLSAAFWKRDSGCSGGGCSCGCCNSKDAPSSPYPDMSASKVPIDSGVNQLSKWLLDLGTKIDLPVLWPSLTPRGPYDSASTDLEKNKTITVSNGDQLTLGGMNGFTLVTKDGEPVRSVGTIDSGAYDAPVEHILSNGAIYRSRGGWNHDESITWPNGDVVRFTDAGKFTAYESKDGTTNSGKDLPSSPPIIQEGDHASESGISFRNGDRFVTTPHGWELITADGRPVTKGSPDPNSPMDATRIPLSNGATLISGGWGTDTISYPDGEYISFDKGGKVKSVNGEPA